MIDPIILDSLALAVPSIAAYIFTVKGVASVITNNFDTQDWPDFGWFKTSSVLDFLASTNKKGKLTGNNQTDSLIKLATQAIPKKTIVGKLLRILS